MCLGCGDLLLPLPPPPSPPCVVVVVVVVGGTHQCGGVGAGNVPNRSFVVVEAALSVVLDFVRYKNSVCICILSITRIGYHCDSIFF